MTKGKDPKPPRPKRAVPATKTNPTTGAFQISDELWEVLAPLIPKPVNTHRFGGGRPRVSDRTCANGICYVLRTGCQWKALDATGICSGSTAHLRFQEWVAAGVFLELWRVGLERYDELKGLDWSWLSMDGALTKLHGNNSLGFYDDDFEDSEYSSALLPRDPGIYCRDYWAEPLNRANAELRNRGFEPQCRSDLEGRITDQYRRLAESLNYNDDENELVYSTPNQYVRILEWLDLSGGDLLNSDHPPYRILQEQSRHPYAHSSGLIPTEDVLADYERETDETLDLEWLGIVRAAGVSEGSSDLLACHYYYPQLFYGYWVPFDPDQMPGRSQSEELEPPRYERATTPVYLPKSVTAKTVRAGYPLGKTSEHYHLCQNSSETEEVGYYYVDHPAGDYCELKP